MFVYHVLALPSLYSLMDKENLAQTQCLLTGKVTGLPLTQFTVYHARFHNSFKGIRGGRTWAAESEPRLAECMAQASGGTANIVDSGPTPLTWSKSPSIRLLTGG